MRVGVRLGDRSRSFWPRGFRGRMYASRSVVCRCAPQLAAARDRVKLAAVASQRRFPVAFDVAQEIACNSCRIPRRVPAVTVASDARRRARELEPLSADRFGVHFTADAELRELIDRARALASHRLPNGDLAGLMKLMAACFVRQEEKRRFGVGARPRRAKTKAESALSAGQETPPGRETPAAPATAPTSARSATVESANVDATYP